MSDRVRSSWQGSLDCAVSLSRIPHRFAPEENQGPTPQPAAASPILVVEDDYLVSMQVETALSDAGFALAGAAVSAEEAIQLAAASRPALVLMDIRLAGRMDGVDAALILFREHGIRCIFATAHHDPEVRRRAAPAQPLAWVQKPYTMPTLLAVIRQALSDLDQDAD